MPVPVTAEDIRAVASEIKKDYREKRKSGYVNAGEVICRINSFWFSYLTGLRRSEIAALKWKDYDASNCRIMLRRQKNRKQQWLPISEKAAGLLRRLPTGEPEHFVFRSPSFTETARNERSFGNNLSRTWRKYRRKAGVSEEKDFHGLRKGFVSELSKQAPAAIVQKAARHKSYETTRRYLAIHDDSIRGALNEAFD